MSPYHLLDKTPDLEQVITKLQKTIAEKDLILSFGSELARVEAKTDLMQIIQEKFRQLFYFYHCAIVVNSEDNLTIRPFLLAPDSKLTETEHYDKIRNGEFRIDDGIIDMIQAAGEPVIINLENAFAEGKTPEYLRIMHQAGVKELMSTALEYDGLKIGALSFSSDIENNFTEELFPAIRSIAGQIALTVVNIRADERIERKEKHTKLLLSLSAEIDQVRDRNDLLYIVKRKLSELIQFTDLAITLYNPERKTFQVFTHEVTEKWQKNAEFQRVIIPEYPVEDGIHEVALHAHGPVIVDIEDAMRSPNKHEGTQFIYDSGIKKMLLVKLMSNNTVIGFLNILSGNEDAFEKINLTIFKGVTDQLSNAVSTVLSLEEIKRRDEENEILLYISSALSSIRDKKDLMHAVKVKLRTALTFSDICIPLYDFEKGTYQIFARDNEVTQGHPDFEYISTAEFPIFDGLQNITMQSNIPAIFPYQKLKDMKMPHIDFIIDAGIREVASVRLKSKNEIIGALVLLSEKDHSFDPEDVHLIERLSHHLATAVSNLLANDKIEQQLTEISKYKQQLEEEKMYLQEEVSIGYSYNDIVGSGTAMQKVFHLLSQVSFTNSTILLLGETGTGKELIARAIHNSSSRQNKLMVKVNCAALPPSLIESELFGHERGSFTGATERRLGKFELANHGTLFLDEIGEMPLDLQVKLLRAIQEREIERVGGKGTIKVDVRIIAATNRNLQKEVDEGRFRGDLFYRLNVFPITLPSLREHKEDIPALASHFVAKYAKNNGKKISQISSNAMKELMAYNWPGNVRELEHLIERSILMSTGNVIREMHLPKPRAEDAKAFFKDVYLKSHEENERDYIIEVLNGCNGKVYGTGGAAEILKLKVGTLNSKIRKLGIKKENTIFKKS